MSGSDSMGLPVAARSRTASVGGRRYWRSLEELAETPDFQDYLEREFPSQLPQFIDPVSRRKFMVLMAASLGLAGLTACTRPSANKILPYVQQPENIIPGEALYYATAVLLSGVAFPVLVESHMGRPTKIEGNPEHPASQGAATAMLAAQVLDLYDPDRATTVSRLGSIRTYDEFAENLANVLTASAANGGEGVRILTETVTSPALADQLKVFRAKYPAAKWVQWEPAGRHAARAGAMAAFGRPVDAVLQLEKADVILSLDADFMVEGPGHLNYAKAYAKRRKLRDGDVTPNRMYAVESHPTTTGTLAEHRLALKPSVLEQFARAAAAALGVAVGGEASRPAQVPEAWFNALVEDLKGARGRSVVVAGEQSPATLHALAHAMNAALGNAGATVEYREPLEAEPTDQFAALRQLTDDMSAGKVQVLMILGGNPVYNAPPELEFVKAMDRVALKTHLSGWNDETSEYCHWHIPEAHTLEAWGDARALDGTVTVMQPLIAPLYGGHSALEVMALMNGIPAKTGYDLVRDYWKTAGAGVVGADFEAWWRRALHNGFAENTTLPAVAGVAVTADAAALGRVSVPEAGGLELIFRTDSAVYDGRFANNGWMQELPRPGSTLTWDNAAEFSPKTAEGMGVKEGDVVSLDVGGRTVELPAMLTPGHAPDSVTVRLGFGRRRAGQVGNDVGVDVYPIRSLASPYVVAGVKATGTGKKHELARTQSHFLMEGRDLVREATLAEYKANPKFAAASEVHGATADISIHDFKFAYDGYKWGMSLDLSLCNGCNACVTACQSENNIPVVGRDQVLRGREMHWLRVDRYYEGDPDNPRALNQPVPCMHCENAPCEMVCPVAATTHDDEGLNAMVYNRCVGTRYCANNCPYKVRRFNFLQYQDWNTETLKMVRNPDVTVRQRGVMEKCTYCVQRISGARIQAKNEGRMIRDGDVVVACQASCPTDAIVFGDLNDSKSQIARAAAHPLNYAMLAELNVRPRTTYMAAVRNPHPSLAENLAPASNSHGEGPHGAPAHGDEMTSGVSSATSAQSHVAGRG
ncbi:molybdopterin oxidoreductase [candidate division BRC1 bacterium HGW-BRC1-1]|nr:MAG: molybdopterin oxidoreductase [candidate division BRC1 bacterium HGW-BRC1-1]